MTTIWHSLVFAVLCLSFTNALTAQAPSAEDKAIEQARLFRTYWGMIDPKLPENNDWPPAMKKRVGWILDNEKAGKLSLVLFGEKFTECRSCLMLNSWFHPQTTPPGQKNEYIPYIHFSLPLFEELVRHEFHVPEGDDLTRGSNAALMLAISLAHEKIHLESKVRFRYTRSKLIEEEIRTRFVESVEILKPLADTIGFGELPYTARATLRAVADCGFKLPCRPLASNVNISLGNYLTERTR